MVAINQKFNTMRVILCVLILFICLNPKLGHAQKPESLNKIFVRVYNLNDKKIGAGKIAFINDGIIGLKRSNAYRSIFLRDIGKIKTKKSGGNYVVKGALIGAGVGLLHGIVNRESDDACDDCLFDFGYSKGFYVATDMVTGAYIGAAAGGVTSILKDRETFMINGDFKQWQLFKDFVVH
jgi:hypothetical protein